MLTAGWVGRALSELQGHFLAQPELINEIVQTLKLRFSGNGACNATVGAPLVFWQVSTPEILELRDRHYEDPIGESNLYWLRGVARLQVEGEDVSGFRSLRSVLADVLVRAPIEHGDEKTWFTSWDAAKTGSLTHDQLVTGLAVLFPAFRLTPDLDNPVPVSKMFIFRRCQKTGIIPAIR